MGIVRKQGTLNLIFTYAGVLLGAANNVVFFQEFLSRGQYGLIMLLLTYMVIGTEISQLGASKVIIRFFPYFRGHPTKEGHFLFLVTSYILGGFLLFAGVLGLSGPFFRSLHVDDAPLFATYFHLVIPLVLAYSSQKVLTTLSQALLKSVVPNITQHVLQRLLQTAAVVGYYLGWWGFHAFVHAFVWGYFLPSLVLLLYLGWLGRLSFRYQPGLFRSRLFGLILTYGLFTTLTETTLILVSRVDIAMLGQMVGEAGAGTYGLAFFIATLISVPARSINAIAIPLVAQHQQRKAWEEVRVLYQKTAINNLLIGAWVMIGIWINLDPFFELFPKHAMGKWAVIWIGLGTLVSVGTGISRAILIHSRLYRFDLYANLVLLGLVVLSNLWLIPRLGLTGAAIATAGSVLLYNAVSVGMIWRKLRIHPFSARHLLALALAAAVLWLGLALPSWGTPLLDMAINSILVSAVYLPAILALDVSPDLTQLARRLWRGGN